MIPAADAVVACTAREADMQAEIDLIWEHLLPALSGRAGTDLAGEQELAARLGDLTVRPLDAGVTGPGEAITFTRSGSPDAEVSALTAIRVEPGEKTVTLTMTVNGSDHAFDLRPGEWTEGQVPGLPGYLDAMAVSGGWASPGEFAADLIGLYAPHRLHLRGHLVGTPQLEVTWSHPPLHSTGLGDALPG
jgi:hypothetical protein